MAFRLVATVAVCLTAGCAVEPALTLTSSLAIDPAHECVVDIDVVRDGPLTLDLAADPPLAVVAVVGELDGVDDGAVFIADGSALYFDDVAALPSADAPLRSPLAGTVDNDAPAGYGGERSGAADIYFASLPPALIDALADALLPSLDAGRRRLDAHLSVRGLLSTNDGATPRSLSSPFFDVPIDVCAGCLVPVCDDDRAPVGDTCFVGVDAPLRCP